MNAEHKGKLACAIYTRKSSEEGLDQTFNSLHAQREACEAFITSQREQGWRALTTKYDDGGYSGGSMERPGLKQLLLDVAAGKIDVLVVYKVDRLTRSLLDFSKIIETLDAHSVSFVSVTQQFNTTTSMGRLTLNILLSFAQFERDVTGERIRDKIAASKRKGMWMGGAVPLGYVVKDRKLVVHPEEADLVRRIFDQYLELGCIAKLKAVLDREEIKSKVRGPRLGGKSYSRGALYYLLQNRIYRGEIPHREKWYPGEHEEIISEDIWQRAGKQLKENIQGASRRATEPSGSLLTGRIEDRKGNRFTPSYTLKEGRRYRYYVSQAVIRNPGMKVAGPTRLPAKEIERLVTSTLEHVLTSPNRVISELGMAEDSPVITQQLVQAARKRLDAKEPKLGHSLVHLIEKVVVHDTGVLISVRKDRCRHFLLGSPAEVPDFDVGIQPATLELETGAQFRRRGSEVRLVLPPALEAEPMLPDPELIKALARAHLWYRDILEGKVVDQSSLAKKYGIPKGTTARVLKCAFLAPQIVEAIVQGRQPDLSVSKIVRGFSLDWPEQVQRFGPKSVTVKNHISGNQIP